MHAVDPDKSLVMREVFMLVGRKDTILWSDASDSPVALPDSRARWEAIWSRRASIVEIAHSHPVGPLAFSHEDATTMDALSGALGKKMTFSVVAPNGMVRCVYPSPVRSPLSPRKPGEEPVAKIVELEPWWTSLLRLASGMNKIEVKK
jgi:hypothetical protein